MTMTAPAVALNPNVLMYLTIRNKSRVFATGEFVGSSVPDSSSVPNGFRLSLTLPTTYFASRMRGSIANDNKSAPRFDK